MFVSITVWILLLIAWYKWCLHQSQTFSISSSSLKMPCYFHLQQWIKGFDQHVHNLKSCFVKLRMIFAKFIIHNIRGSFTLLFFVTLTNETRSSHINVYLLILLIKQNIHVCIILDKSYSVTDTHVNLGYLYLISLMLTIHSIKHACDVITEYDT